MAFFLIGAGLVLLALSLLFRVLHRRYLLYLQITPVERWRHVLSVIFALSAGLCLPAGILFLVLRMPH